MNFLFHQNRMIKKKKERKKIGIVKIFVDFLGFRRVAQWNSHVIYFLGNISFFLLIN